MAIIMNQINSSSMQEIGYEKNVMKIKFISGKIYEFKKVPKIKFNKLINSLSKGAFFNKEIRGKFDYNEIEI